MHVQPNKIYSVFNSHFVNDLIFNCICLYGFIDGSFILNIKGKEM